MKPRARHGSVGSAALAFALAVAAAGSLLTGAARGAEPPRAPQGVRFVYLIRHGMYDRVDSLDDRTANGLNTLGHEQARLLARRLGALHVRARLLVSSDYTRARETADEIGAVLGIHAARDTLLEECTPRSIRAAPAGDADSAEAMACEDRLEAAWRKYFRPSPDADEQDLVVCHGNVIRWFVCRALGSDARRWILMDIANASLTVVAVRPDGSARLVIYSDVGHLPVSKQTWLGRGPGWALPSW
jgi:serine/threonine-protein phosphatase PGAM5